MKKNWIKAVIILPLLIVIALLAFFFYPAKNSGCRIHLLQSYKIKEFFEKGKAYFLYAHISGAHDKAYYYSLYEGDPRIDDCGAPESKSLVYEYVADKKVAKKIIIKPDGLELIYRTRQEMETWTPPESEGGAMTDVNVEVQGIPQ